MDLYTIAKNCGIPEVTATLDEVEEMGRLDDLIDYIDGEDLGEEEIINLLMDDCETMDALGAISYVGLDDFSRFVIEAQEMGDYITLESVIDVYGDTTAEQLRDMVEGCSLADHLYYDTDLDAVEVDDDLLDLIWWDE